MLFDEEADGELAGQCPHHYDKVCSDHVVLVWGPQYLPIKAIASWIVLKKYEITRGTCCCKIWKDERHDCFVLMRYPWLLYSKIRKSCSKIYERAPHSRHLWHHVVRHKGCDHYNKAKICYSLYPNKAKEEKGRFWKCFGKEAANVHGADDCDGY